MVAAVLLIAAVPAAAQPNFTWVGGGSTRNWSDTVNWAGGVAPSGSGGKLTFDFACQTPPEAACGANDDIAGVDANSLQLDGDWADPYGIKGSQVLTLGAGGLTSSAAGGANLQLPLTLGAAQTWTVSDPLQVSHVTGAGVPLSIELTAAGTQFTVAGDVEVGAVNVSGPGTLQTAGSLNSADGGSVNLSGGTQLQVGDDGGSVGSLTLSGSTIALTNPHSGAPPPVLQVDGNLTLNSTSTLAAGLGWVSYNVGPGAISDSAVGGVIDATGAVSLGDASLTFPPPALGEGGDCALLQAGQVSTLVQTTGQLTGTFSGIPNGTVVAVPSCGGDADNTVRINYSPSAVTATVIDGQPGPTGTTELLNPANPQVNEPVTITTTVDALYGTPAGTVTVYLGGAELPGCVRIPVQSSGSTGIATCQTSLGSAGTELPIGAEFDSSNTETASSNSAQTVDNLYELVSVARGSSAARLSASATRVADGASVGYTATVTPGYNGRTKPTGHVEFLDDGSPIAGCGKQPLTAGPTSSTAHCSTSFTTTGTDAITASYRGDTNFAGSTTGTVSTFVVLGRAGRTLLAQLSSAVDNAKFAGLWTPHGVALPFPARRPGELAIRWYLDTGAGHRRLIATTTHAFKQAGTAKIRLMLDRRARHVLSRLHHARITADASFTTRGARPVGAATSFTIMR